MADLLTTANQSTVKVITFTQDQFLKAYKAVASKVPSGPSWMTPDPEQGRKAVERAFQLQSQLLEQNKAFALGLIDAGTKAPASTGK